MSESVKSVDDVEISIKDEILKALTGKVAEMGSVLNESTVQLKKVNEIVGKFPFLEKRFEAVESRMTEVTQKAEEIVDRVVNLSVPAESIGALRRELVDHAQLFKAPLRKEVHYRHMLGWPIVVVVLAVMFALGMFGFWQDARNQLSAKEENDIKFRFMQLSSDSVVRVRLHAADAAWQADADQFKKAVETDEQVLTENTVNYLRKTKLDSEMRAAKKSRGR